ncbi:hypothetical protein EJP82_11290 [Paenibacillus anaericanus]|uniref:Uncharacterized protein n=1 Tax=Paenibacillus anaericanus TaxID=170367 RepID=A0A3S1DQ18_9BACL|nr:hypothetical protein EJP82_11290 [Paenibacillus anaericanus]
MQKSLILSAAFFVGGIHLRKKNKLLSPTTEWIQPEFCKGCIWGRWEGTKQFCSRPRCVLDVTRAGKEVNTIVEKRESSA